MAEYFDLGLYRRVVSTKSVVAQIWFDRGLLWCFGYNHDESVTCFQKAIQADPDLAIAYWGIAYASGCNCNPGKYSNRVVQRRGAPHLYQSQARFALKLHST